jgi:hypothetical protein
VSGSPTGTIALAVSERAILPSEGVSLGVILERKVMMRRFGFLSVLCTVAVLASAGVALAEAGGHFVGTPECDIDGTATIECAGKIAGFGNQSVGAVYVVITTPAGCSSTGNPDIPGQRNFVSGALQPDSNGNFLFGPGETNSVTGSVSCHGNQVASISSGGTLSVYSCTSGAPTFNNKKNPSLQTNPNCTLQDTSTFTLTEF